MTILSSRSYIRYSLYNCYNSSNCFFYGITKTKTKIHECLRGEKLKVLSCTSQYSYTFQLFQSTWETSDVITFWRYPYFPIPKVVSHKLNKTKNARLFWWIANVPLEVCNIFPIFKCIFIIWLKKATLKT